MYRRCSLALLIPLSFSSVSLVADTSAEPIKDIGFHDWTGSRIQTEMSDNSLLTEYKAQTLSTVLSGATLTVSFVPRFDCVPMVSVQLPKDHPDIESNVSLTLDQREFDFPTLAELDDEQQIHFSLNAESARQQQLRQLIDTASRAVFQWTAAEQTDGEAEPGGSRAQKLTTSLSFSLLGSKATLEDVEQQCIGHIPIPYDG